MEKNRNRSHKKRDLWLIAGVFMVAALFYGGNLFLNRTPAVMVEVTVDGVVVEELNINHDTQMTIPSYGNGTNLLVISDGNAYISEASCPDKVCVHQGKVHQSGEMLVCLPNRMIAKIVGND